MIISLILLIHSITASVHTGAVMPDGKVDKVVMAPGQWHGPIFGVDVSADFTPDWHALQAWNNASVGVGLSYWNMGHEKLGHAIAPYAYMDIPLVKLPHFQLGLRPGIGAAFMTKTYRNTIPDGHMFVDMIDANQSIGSVTNLYFPEAIYLRFPIAQGWGIGLSAGWYHMSNGSTRQPNSGYNIFAGEIALSYDFTAQSTANYRITSHTNAEDEKHMPSRKWSILMTATAGGRQVYYRDQQTFAVASMHAAAYWHAHQIFRLGAGVDVFYDGAYVQRETKFVKTNLSLAQPRDCWRVGISLQPELVVGHFTAGFHVGAYMYDPVKNLEPYSEIKKKEELPQERLDKSIFYAYDLLKAGTPGNPDGWLYTSVVLRYHLPWNVVIQAMMKSHLTKVEMVTIGLGFYY